MVMQKDRNSNSNVFLEEDTKSPTMVHTTHPTSSLVGRPSPVLKMAPNQILGFLPYYSKDWELEAS